MSHEGAWIWNCEVLLPDCRKDCMQEHVLRLPGQGPDSMKSQQVDFLSYFPPQIADSFSIKEIAINS
jgi:hypothetical protein